MDQFVRLGMTFLVALIFVSCAEPVDPAKQAEVERLRAEVDELALTYSSLLEEKQQLTTQNRADEALIRNLDHNFKGELETRAEAEEIRNYVDALQSAEAQVKQSLEVWRRATRESFVGRKMPTLSLRSGTRFSNVVVVGVSDDFFAIQAEGGERVEVPFADVSEQVRYALVHEPSILVRELSKPGAR